MTTPDQKWLRGFHPAPARPISLICLPHSGGAANSYFGLSAALGGVAGGLAEVFAVQYPGRHDRWAEPPLTDLRALADAVAKALLDRADDRPLALFGHSLGSALAFEVTRRLEEADRAPIHLFASAGRAPSRPRTERVHLLDDAGLVTELRGLGGTDPRVFDDPELLELVLPALRADYTAIETYQAAPDDLVHCPITVLIGADDPSTSAADARAWQAHTTGPCDLLTYPGGHFYLHDQLPDIVAAITTRLTD